MHEENTTIEAGSSAAENDGGASYGDLESTVDFLDTAEESSAETKNTDNGEDEEQAAGSSRQEEEDKKNGAENELTRFDKHPRFQQLIRERRELNDRIAKLEGMLNENGRKDDAGRQQLNDGKDVGDLLSMKEDDLVDMMTDNPKGFIQKLTRLAMEQTLSASEAKQKERDVYATYEKYGNDNPDFNEMWDNGEIQKFMEKNPGHTAISAHMAMTAENRIEDAVQKAVAEAEKKIRREFQVKRGAETLGAGSGARGAVNNGEIPPELKDTKKFGGVTSVLANRLRAMRSEAG